MMILNEAAWQILERAEYLHDRGATMAEIAADTGQSERQLTFLFLTGPSIRDALVRAIRAGSLRVQED